MFKNRTSDLGALAAAVMTIGLAVRHCVGAEYDEALVSAIKIALKAAQKGGATPPEVIVALVGKPLIREPIKEDRLMFTNRILCLLCGYADHISKQWEPGPESWAPLEIYLTQEREGFEANKEERDLFVRKGIEIGNAPFIARGLKRVYDPADPGFG